MKHKINSLAWNDATSYKDIFELTKHDGCLFIDLFEGYKIFQWRKMYFAISNIDTTGLFFTLKDIKMHLLYLGDGDRYA